MKAISTKSNQSLVIVNNVRFCLLPKIFCWEIPLMPKLILLRLWSKLFSNFCYFSFYSSAFFASEFICSQNNDTRVGDWILFVSKWHRRISRSCQHSNDFDYIDFRGQHNFVVIDIAILIEFHLTSRVIFSNFTSWKRPWTSDVFLDPLTTSF